jgi:hypothetical protein
MHRSLLLAVLSLSVLLSTLVAAQDALYTFTPLMYPPVSPYTQAYALNDYRQITGNGFL